MEAVHRQSNWPNQAVESSFADNYLQLWKVDLDNFFSKAVTDNAGLDEKEMDKCRRLHDPQNRLRFAASHTALRSILSKAMRCHPSKVAYDYNRWGKPHVLGGPSFSLSRSGGVAIIAVGLGRLGVDIESLNRSVELSWFSQFWTSSEQKHLPDIEWSSQGLLRVWSRKEAVVKALGRGLSHPLTDVAVPLHSKLIADSYWTLAKSDLGYQAVLCRDLDVHPGFVATIASDTATLVQSEIAICSL